MPRPLARGRGRGDARVDRGSLALCIVALAATLAALSTPAPSLSSLEREHAHVWDAPPSWSTWTSPSAEDDIPERDVVAAAVASGAASNSDPAPRHLATLTQENASTTWTTSPLAVTGASSSYVDSCSGKSQAVCTSGRFPQCTWDVTYYPWCFNAKLLELRPSESVDVTSNIGISRKFFNFNFGVFLSEGTWVRTVYNADADECADLCMRATSDGVSAKRYRCSGFNFFPVELPLYSEPWSETIRTGVCELTTSDNDWARLRNEDEGLTNAELYYTSHFSHRPFSEESGFWQLRDPRGGRVSYLLQYDPVQSGSVTASSIWPRSRWGMVYIKAPESVFGSTMTQCGRIVPRNTLAPTSPTVPGPEYEQARRVLGSEPETETEIRAQGEDGTRARDLGLGTGVTEDEDAYVGGFTPVDDDTKCTGLVTKSEAKDLCAGAGGRLCTTTELAALRGKQIGCSLDSHDVWSAADADDGSTKFARCCASYNPPIDCDAYADSARYRRCASLDLADCLYKGSGTSLQSTLGFGRLMTGFRTSCANGDIACRRAVVSEWKPRDACIWCPASGSASSGQCRPGNNFGVCPNADAAVRDAFAANVKAMCGLATMCRLATMFTDWASL